MDASQICFHWAMMATPYFYLYLFILASLAACGSSLGQGWSLCHGSDLSCCSDNTWSLTLGSQENSLAFFFFSFFFFWPLQEAPTFKLDLSSQTRDWTWVTAVKGGNLNHKTTRELPSIMLSFLLSCKTLSISEFLSWCSGNKSDCYGSQTLLLLIDTGNNQNHFTATENLCYFLA